MICINSLNIGLNRFLLLAVGLWPYQQSKLVRLQLISFFCILTTFILCQLTTLLTSQCTPDFIMKILSSVLFFMMFVIKYRYFNVNIKFVQNFLEQLQHICNELTDKNEINIIKQYASSAKRYTTTLTLLAVLIISAFILYQTGLYIFNILLPIHNKSRPCSLLFVTEYFVDQERYFYLITLHTYAAFGIGSAVMLATGTILIVCMQYACGMFQIASYRIARTTNTLEKSNLKNENLTYKGLIYAVNMHCKAMKFCDLILSRFQVMFFLLILIGVICGSLNFFLIFQVISFKYDTSELLLPLIGVIVHFSYSSIGNYIAQEVIDHNNNIFVTVYNIQWYLAPLQVQRMLLFLLQRGTKEFTMNIAGLFVGSLESAATVRKISFKKCINRNIFYMKKSKQFISHYS
ncbi:uncharacterized protein LOC105834272 isoform X1 [Monomorium pharaonis]|uniref:uncharacterized protein LOC105834272 isoform X1 n=1 Tax=Monomorium pharaonis TaxID=307658 RepID=UPI00174746DA|nr:uncharacterized protein LOC105834272 isoform X1 [Monomorium pharaonis]